MKIKVLHIIIYGIQSKTMFREKVIALNSKGRKEKGLKPIIEVSTFSIQKKKSKLNLKQKEGNNEDQMGIDEIENRKAIENNEAKRRSFRN